MARIARTIVRTIARRVWDSRGRPTLEVEVALDDGAVGRGIAPAGASRGAREAIDARDGGTRLGGFDVRGAVDTVTTLVAPRLAAFELVTPLAADRVLLELDDSPTKSQQAEAARAWRGRSCTPTSCGPLPATTAGSVLGFGAAALGAAWVSRRRGRPTRRI